jgi:NAD(P)-dependent dehydrogenase (short-subunit alcohol dehydrogenase family)
MAAKLEGKVAIITGSASGIGAATASAFAREGARVVVADVNLEAAQRHAATIIDGVGEAIAVRVDLGEEASIASMIETTVAHFGGLDVLHNNAADTRLSSTRDLSLEKTDIEVWDALWRVNLRGAMIATKYAIPRLRARGGGSIINTASGSAFSGMLSNTSYGILKAGIVTMTKYVATQHGKENIRCNAISPGLIVTPATADTYAGTEVGKMMLRHQLTPRFGKPEDIAEMAVYLASDAAGFITGQCISVDGGLDAHTPIYADGIAVVSRRNA